MTATKRQSGVGRRLASARIQRGLSQGSLGRLARVAPSYLSRIENGKLEPSFKLVHRIAGAMRVGLDELMGPVKRTDARPDGCPISQSGRCMLDLIHSEAQRAKPENGERYTVREIRMLQSLTEWMQIATPDRLRAFEVLLGDLLRERRASG
jgi:transcriptional regulator with XRE-family HTH domain